MPQDHPQFLNNLRDTAHTFLLEILKDTCTSKGRTIGSLGVKNLAPQLEIK
jgi:hypothetical protein